MDTSILSFHQPLIVFFSDPKQNGNASKTPLSNKYLKSVMPIANFDKQDLPKERPLLLDFTLTNSFK